MRRILAKLGNPLPRSARRWRRIGQHLRSQSWLIRWVLVPWCIAMVAGFIAFTAVENIRTILPGKIYVSGQPWACQARRRIDYLDIKTVINLRGTSQPITQRVMATVDPMPVKMFNIRLSARKLPPKPVFLQLIDAVEQTQPPVYIFCQQGIDRSGLAAFLMMMKHGGQDFQAARGQLSDARYGWIGYSRPVNDVVDLYADYCEHHHLDPSDWANLRHWAEHVYEGDGVDYAHGEPITPADPPALQVSTGQTADDDE